MTTKYRETTQRYLVPASWQNVGWLAGWRESTGDALITQIQQTRVTYSTSDERTASSRQLVAHNMFNKFLNFPVPDFLTCLSVYIQFSG
jgi:hypothetical protein